MAPSDDISAEDRLIARFFEPIATDPGALGLSDDAAFIKPPPRCDLVLKADAIVGGVHFFPEDAAQAVASKALRVNLSDLAAKGARPLGFLLSLAIPTDIKEDWLGGFAEGLRGDAVLFRTPEAVDWVALRPEDFVIGARVSMSAATAAAVFSRSIGQYPILRARGLRKSD